MNDKEMKIVKAVNELKGDLGNLWDAGWMGIDNGSLMLARCEGGDRLVDKSGIHRHWERTIEGLNICIEEMAAAKWTNPRHASCDYESYKLIMAGSGIDTSNKTLLKENCDQSLYELVYTQEMHDNDITPPIGATVKIVGVESDSRINDFEGKEVVIIGKSELISEDRIILTFSHPRQGVGCGCFFKGGVFHPIKSKQEIELEEARKKQVDDMLMEYLGIYSVDSEIDARDMFRRMQENGHLAEIALPLEV